MFVVRIDLAMVLTDCNLMARGTIVSVPKHFNKFDRNTGIKGKGGPSPTEGVASMIFGQRPNGRENGT